MYIHVYIYIYIYIHTYTHTDAVNRIVVDDMRIGCPYLSFHITVMLTRSRHQFLGRRGPFLSQTPVLVSIGHMVHIGNTTNTNTTNHATTTTTTDDNIHTCTYICIYTHVYIYIYRERKISTQHSMIQTSGTDGRRIIPGAPTSRVT